MRSRDVPHTQTLPASPFTPDIWPSRTKQQSSQSRQKLVLDIPWMCLMGKEAACCCLLAPDFLLLFKTGCFLKSAFRDVSSGRAEGICPRSQMGPSSAGKRRSSSWRRVPSGMWAVQTVTWCFSFVKGENRC